MERRSGGRGSETGIPGGDVEQQHTAPMAASAPFTCSVAACRSTTPVDPPPGVTGAALMSILNLF